MLKSGFFVLREEDKASAMYLDNVVLNTELDEYVRDLLEFGLGKYDAEFVELAEDGNKTFHLWSKYRKEQVQQLLLNNICLLATDGKSLVDQLRNRAGSFNRAIDRRKKA